MNNLPGFRTAFYFPKEGIVAEISVTWSHKKGEKQ